MAKGKGKGGSSGGPHKKHGPKTKRFHGYSKCLRMAMSKHGVLTKYCDREAFDQAVTARGVRKDIDALWKDYIEHWCETPEKKKEFFLQLKK